MRIDNDLSDDAFLAEVGKRIARVRMDRSMTQAALALEAGVARNTVSRLEVGKSIPFRLVARVLRVLGLLGNFHSLIPEDTIRPSERMTLQAGRRKRASAKSKKPKPADSLPWKKE